MHKRSRAHQGISAAARRAVFMSGPEAEFAALWRLSERLRASGSGDWKTEVVLRAGGVARRAVPTAVAQLEEFRLATAVILTRSYSFEAVRGAQPPAILPSAHAVQVPTESA